MTDIFYMLAGMVGIFLPAVMLTLLSGKSFDSFLGWAAVWMFAAAMYSVVPTWFEYLALVIAGIFLYMKVFVR